MFDLIIKNALIADGTGAPAYHGDIAVKDGLIAAMGNFSGDAHRVIDACGLVAAPGFIDAHSHSDTGLRPGEPAANFLQQGTTTQLAGQCGMAPVPRYEGVFDSPCDTFSEFFKTLEGKPLCCNYAFLAGHCNLRGAVMGYSPNEPTTAQLRQMEDILRQAMEDGAFGFSTGLVYAPSVYGKPEEIAALAKVAAEYDGIYTSHIRGEGNDLLSSIDEAIAVARASGIRTVISHIKVIGKHNEGRSAEALKMINDARAMGLDIRCDQYPFTAGSAPFISQLPPRFATAGLDALTESLKDPAVRAEIEKAIFEETDVFESGIYSAGYENILISSAAKTPQYEGMFITDIAKDMGLSCFDASCELLIRNEGTVQANYLSQNESDMLRFMAQDYVMAGSDWSNFELPSDPMAPSGGHPRGIGTMPRRLELIREHQLMSMEKAVRSITSLPAETYGIRDRGILAPGKKADITVFDWNSVRCTADFVHPNRPNEGIRTVILNGVPVVENGLWNGSFAGELIRRK